MADPLNKTIELRLSLAVGLGIAVQSAFALIWAGGAAERITQLESRAQHGQEVIVRTARLEEQVSAIRATLMRIERKIDHANEEAKR